MQRSAVRTGLRHGRIDTSRSSIIGAQCLVQTTTPRSFHTTPPARDDDDGSKNSRSGRERSAAAASELGSLKRPSAAPVDARSLGATAAKPSNVINLRSLRGSPSDPNRPARFRDATANGPRPSFRGGSSDTHRGRFAAGAGGRSLPRYAGARDGGLGGRGGGMRGGRRGRGGRGGGANRRKRDNDKERKGDEHEGGKLEWGEEEQAYIDSQEQGVVTGYTPVVTHAMLRGYGPAVATDASLLGKVEVALQNMRVLGGGRPFNSTSPIAHDVHDDFKRYFGKKLPVWYDTVAEKEWVEASRPGLKIEGPSEAVKEAVMNGAITGRYEPPKFADLSDVKGIIASFHAKDVSYKTADTKSFADKVISLLPGATKEAKEAAARPKKL